MKKILIFMVLAIITASCSQKLSQEDLENANKPLTAIMKTTKGEIELKLFGEQAPLTVANFINLAKRGYYDGILFHRVVSNFMIQTGDPLTLDKKKENSWGMGSPGYKFEDEVNNGLLFDGAGILAMANSGPGTNGSQIFITHNATPHLNNKHTIFGQVKKGQQVVNDIKKMDKIISIKIIGKVPASVKAKQNRVDQWNKVLDKQTVEKVKNLELRKATQL
jgi:peptidyl-prolyl cis-trans isomerase B (cyclophilin B)